VALFPFQGGSCEPFYFIFHPIVDERWDPGHIPLMNLDIPSLSLQFFLVSYRF
jgi:hypothetical protein